MTAFRTHRTRRRRLHPVRSAAPLALALLSVLLLAGVAAAQDEAAPAEPEARLLPAQVRVAHLSPNAPTVTVALEPLLGEDADGDGNEDRGEAVVPEALTGLAYGDTTDYVEVEPGAYVVTVSADDTTVLESEFDVSVDSYTTVAAIGLVLPEEAQGEGDEEEGGFIGFIRNLFGDGDADRDALELQLVVLQDDLARAIDEGETLVRVLHASPGTEGVDLAVAGEEGVIIRGVEFGETSPYRSTDAATENLELRIEGSRAASIELSQTDLTAGAINTIMLIGTSLEEAPIEAVVLSDAPLAPPSDGAPVGDAGAAVGGAADAADAAADAAQDEAAAEGDDAAAQEGDDAAAGEGEEAPADAEAPTLDALVAEQDDLTVLATALEQSGFMQTLAGPESYTLFAPTDAAFDALSQEQLDALLADTEALNAVLSNHLVQGEILSEALASEGEITTAQGSALVVPGDGTIGGAGVVEADLRASNGVIHKIDTLLIPQNLELPAPAEGEGGGG